MEIILRENKPFILGKCRCGCGIDIPIQYRGRTTLQKYKNGHNHRGIKSPKGCFGQKENHPLWKGGISLDNGYVYRRCDGHPKAKKKGSYVLEHILIMEKNIGRYLLDNEIVHHINKNRSDNNIENLQLMTRAEHTRIHALGNTYRRGKKF